MFEEHSQGFSTLIPMSTQLRECRDVLVGVRVARPGISSPDGRGLCLDIFSELLDELLEVQRQTLFIMCYSGSRAQVPSSHPFNVCWAPKATSPSPFATSSNTALASAVR